MASPPWFTAVALACLILLSTGASAQTALGLRLAPTTGSRIEIAPGGVATAGVRITSSLDYDVRCIAMFDLPVGWRTLVGEGGFTVQPGSEESRLFSIAVPRAAPAGDYTVVLSIHSGDTGVDLQQIEFTVVVLSRLGIDVEVVHAPRTVVAGQPYTMTFRLANRSNRTEQLRFDIRSIPELETSVDTAAMVLAPGESRELAVTAHTSSDAMTQFRQMIELMAWLVSDRAVSTQGSALVSVMPITSFVGEEIQVPLQLTLRNTAENQESGSQGELYGAGSFSATGNDRYELLLRGPDNRTQSLLGRRDEYRLLYESNDLSLIVGDQTFRLTPLTELGRYAFGANSRVRIDRVDVGAFVNRARWSPARTRQAGGYASYTLAPQAKVGVNYLHRTDATESDILSVQSEVGLLDIADIAVELGGSRSAGVSGGALSLQLRSRPDWIQYGAHLIHAEPGFTGYYQNFDAKALNVTVFPVGLLRVEGYYRNEKRGLDLDPALLHAPQNQSMQIGAGFGNYVAAYFKLVRQQDLLPQPKYDREDKTLIMRFGAHYQSGSVYANIDVGRTEELLLKRSYPLSRFSLSTRFQPDPDQGYNVSIEYSSTKDLFTELSREGVSWNASAWFRIAPPLEFQASLYESWTIAPVRQRNTITDASLEYTLPFGHRISLMGRINQITNGYERDNHAYSIEYIVPFALSFSNSGAGGSVEGRVIDEETAAGIGNLIIHAGEQVAVTDDDGFFAFPNLRVGTYPITIDRGIIGPDRITSQPLPGNLEVIEGQRRYLEIGVTTSGSIAGTVLRTGHPGRKENQPLEMRGVIVEISKGEELFRRVTDSGGRFLFTDLRPGEWTVRVLEDDIPPDLRVENASQLVVLSPGLDVQTRLDLVPVQKRIRILQEGTLLRPE